LAISEIFIRENTTDAENYAINVIWLKLYNVIIDAYNNKRALQSKRSR